MVGLAYSEGWFDSGYLEQMASNVVKSQQLAGCCSQDTIMHYTVVYSTAVVSMTGPHTEETLSAD